jgi:hypothetical protein
LLDRGRVMRRRISRNLRAGGDPELQQRRLPEIGHEGSEIILPQIQVAAGAILGIFIAPNICPSTGRESPRGAESLLW